MPTLGEAVTPLCYENDHEAFQAQAFTGTFATVFERIRTSVEDGEPIGFWDPGRLVVGALEYKIARWYNLRQVPELLTATSGLAISIHAGKLTAEHLSAYTELIREGYDGLLDQSLHHERDHVSAKSAAPEYSQAAAKALYDHTEGDSMLFVPLGRGGITPGIFTYLHYARLSQGTETSFYPVRFARCSEQDEEPQVTKEEAAHMRQVASSKERIVIYDEDASTGRTLKKAARFFSALLDRETLPLANRGSDPTDTEPLLGTTALNRTKDLTNG